MVTDALVPLLISQAANEHWLFHGNLGGGLRQVERWGYEDRSGYVNAMFGYTNHSYRHTCVLHAGFLSKCILRYSELV